MKRHQTIWYVFYLKCNRSSDRVDYIMGDLVLNSKWKRLGSTFFGKYKLQFLVASWSWFMLNHQHVDMIYTLNGTRVAEVYTSVSYFKILYNPASHHRIDSLHIVVEHGLIVWLLGLCCAKCCTLPLHSTWPRLHGIRRPHVPAEQGPNI